MRFYYATYFEQWLNGLVYDLFFPCEMHARKLHLFDRLTWLVVLKQLSRNYLSKTTYNPESRRKQQLHKESLFYQSQENQAIVDIMKVTRGVYPDPTSADLQWLTCNFLPVQTLPRPVPLAVMERVDKHGRVIGFSIMGVSQFRKGKPLEADLVPA